MVETSDLALRRSLVRSPTSTAGALGWRSIAATVSAARAGVAGEQRHRPRRRGRTAPGPPRPRSHRRRAPSPRSPGRRTARAGRPRRPGGRCCRRAPRRRAGAGCSPPRPARRAPRPSVSERHRLALERHGQRQPAPRRVQAFEMRGEPARGHPDRVVGPVQPGRVVRRPVQHRGQRMRDRVTQDGALHGPSAGLGGFAVLVELLHFTARAPPGSRRTSSRPS